MRHRSKAQDVQTAGDRGSDTKESVNNIVGYVDFIPADVTGAEETEQSAADDAGLTDTGAGMAGYEDIDPD